MGDVVMMGNDRRNTKWDGRSRMPPWPRLLSTDWAVLCQVTSDLFRKIRPLELILSVAMLRGIESQCRCQNEWLGSPVELLLAFQGAASDGCEVRGDEGYDKRSEGVNRKTRGTISVHYSDHVQRWAHTKKSVGTRTAPHQKALMGCVEAAPVPASTCEGTAEAAQHRRATPPLSGGYCHTAVMAGMSTRAYVEDMRAYTWYLGAYIKQFAI
ncbi:hypothetical protein OE88DRAFT_1644911 [Heliocybe sulcata]|uniref:Uncharacterized protein n=1 Tax=Heliocybe sulcata TaxID=5364 RepID=A0A5C3N2F3_9AGAM|nr:hypothetical protein OE88DRAFT_1644911 [Heliocybe sulcata]